jgi:hypothetical protein
MRRVCRDLLIDVGDLCREQGKGIGQGHHLGLLGIAVLRDAEHSGRLVRELISLLEHLVVKHRHPLIQGH